MPELPDEFFLFSKFQTKKEYLFSIALVLVTVLVFTRTVHLFQLFFLLQYVNDVIFLFNCITFAG